jgi:uncharacterized membrane protein YebE (DUF533 family)
MAPLRRMLDRRVDRDGAMPAVEAAPPAGLEPASPVGRRERLGLPAEMLDRALAQKVLHGWLQNRNQVLVPLTLSLGTLRADDIELLMRFAAASLLAASEADAEAQEAVRRWLASVGAGDAAMLVFGRALQAPSALSTLLGGVRTRQLEAYAYAIAAVAADGRTSSGRLYADYVAARLALPADAVRSINRRYRR